MGRLTWYCVSLLILRVAVFILTRKETKVGEWIEEILGVDPVKKGSLITIYFQLYALVMFIVMVLIGGYRVRFPRWAKVLADSFFVVLSIKLAQHVEDSTSLLIYFIVFLHFIALANAILVFENVGILDCVIAALVDGLIHQCKEPHRAIWLVAVVSVALQIVKHANECCTEENLIASIKKAKKWKSDVDSRLSSLLGGVPTAGLLPLVHGQEGRSAIRTARAPPTARPTVERMGSFELIRACKVYIETRLALLRGSEVTAGDSLPV